MTEHPNPFIASDKAITEQYERFGINDLDAIGRAKVLFEISRRISSLGITDEVEKQKVYTEVKQWYLEYRKSLESHEPIDQNSEEKDTNIDRLLEDANATMRFKYDMVSHLANIVAGEGYADFCREWWDTHNCSLEGCYEAWHLTH